MHTVEYFICCSCILNSDFELSSTELPDQLKSQGLPGSFSSPLIDCGSVGSLKLEVDIDLIGDLFNIKSSYFVLFLLVETRL